MLGPTEIILLLIVVGIPAAIVVTAWRIGNRRRRRNLERYNRQHPQPPH